MLTDTRSKHEDVIACDVSALTPEQRDRWMIVGRQMYAAAEEIQDLPNGYALRLPSTSEMLMIIAEDLTMERLCCPFLTFTLELTPHQGVFWLRMTGNEEAKAFLKISFESSDLLNEQVVNAAGLNITHRMSLDSVDAAIEATNKVNADFASGRLS
jgi:hypothetical protein